MLTARVRLDGRRLGRLLLLVMLVAGAAGLSVSSALAAPAWHVTMAHRNPFGFQARIPGLGCPGLQSTAAPPCGIDPLTEGGAAFANGEAFPRESSGDRYEIKVENEGNATAGTEFHVGETLHCIAGPVTGATTVTYQWLRGGVPITGVADATETEYQLQSADREKWIQCEVTAIGEKGTTVQIAPHPAIVAPGPPASPPTGLIRIPGHGNQHVGTTAKCETALLTGATLPLSYQWLRNGKPIEGVADATTNEYKTQAADVNTAVQCQVTTAGVGYRVVSSSQNVLVPREKPEEAQAGAPELPLPLEEVTIPLVVVTDTLPAGMTFVSSEHNARERPIINGGAGPNVVWQCTTTNDAMQCATTKTLAPGESYAPIDLHVHVSAQAGMSPPTNIATNVATVAGGGAGSASSAPAEGATPILPAVPFGLDTFLTRLENSSGEPFDQAGGHPFGYRTEFTFNYTTATEPGGSSPKGLEPAGGAPKEVQDELPPGFVGNVQNVPQCPMRTLLNSAQGKTGACPENTAVGYVESLSIGGGEGIEQGLPELFTPVSEEQNSNLIYNLQPSGGQPAEFGFTITINETSPIVLAARVRSDGDYGVTVDSVGANGLNLGELTGVKVRFCESGATMENSLIGGTTTVLHKFACRPIVPTSKPFNRTPTQCTSREEGKTAAPATTLRANSWNEPALYAAMASYANAPSGPQANVNQPPTSGTPVASSLMTGCQSLTLDPKLEFKPSPPSEGGSTQADEPTGITLSLNVPQTNEAALNATPDLKNIELKLPPGMTVSPSAANGLQACSNAQFGLGTEFGPNVAKPTEPAKPASCPPASQIGTAEVFTPLLSGSPAIQGVPFANEVLTCSQGDWSRGPWSLAAQQLEAGVEELENGNHETLKLSYQWLRNGGSIPGATGREYTVPSNEVPGEALQCQVKATNLAGHSVAVSRDAVVLEGVDRFHTHETSTPPPFPPSSIDAPSGTRSPGNALTCSSEPWTGEPKPTLSYQWLRNGSEIAGATEPAYTLTAEDEGKSIQCQVTGSNTGGETIADSAAVIVPPVPSPAPPLPGAPLQGQLFVAEPECSPCTEAKHDAAEGRLVRQFLQVRDPSAGVIAKLHGTGSLNEQTGQLTTTFLEQPETPFELLQVKLKGGPRAPLANPPSCGAATTTSDITPWSAPGLGGLSGKEPVPGTPDATPESSFNVDFNGAGEACPGTMPFAPSFNAGTTGPKATAAGEPTNFSVTFGRNDREQDLSGFTMQMPLGLVGKVPAVKKCGEAEIAAAEHNTGECPTSSEIGTATTLAGPGPDPFPTTGHVYFTGPYGGAPFGVVVVTLAKAGPFNLGNVVVRSAINIDEHTAAVTVTTPKLPQIVSGVPIRLRAVDVNVTKPGFMLNPTNCSEQHVTGTLDGAGGAGAQVSSPFGISGCKNLPFAPKFTATTQANATKADGASLAVKITYPAGAYANIAKSVTELPAALPSRLTTIQQACPDTVFEGPKGNPAACDPGSVVGYATARTPLLENPLTGPAYLVSHGNAAFPDIEIVLQGEGVTLVLDGQTDIKGGVTKTTFNAVPDSPVSSFELILPEGPHSALAANGDLCTTPLNFPTILTAQNGAVMKQNTKIAVTGCPPTVAITKAKLAGNAVLVTVKLSATGTVKITGKGLKTTTNRNLKAGTHQIRVALTKVGRSMRKHHKKVSLHVSLTVGKQAVVAKATTVRL